MNFNSKIVITGGAGLLGQNTILMLREKGYKNITAIDKHSKNIKILRKLNPDIKIIEADVAEKGEWQKSFENADMLILNHAQITSLYLEEFERNNVLAVQNVLTTAKLYKIPYIVNISSSVVVSVADDFYTATKRKQEKLVDDCGITHCSLRPTLMFGWFDKKHLGYLSRLMVKLPVFPVPGNGKFMRQPLYVRDMAKVVIAAMEQQPQNKTYNIIGREDIFYIDIIRKIKKIKKLKTFIVTIPYNLFKFLMEFYAIFSKKPPFTSQQLEALVAGDYFESDKWWEIFNIESTSLDTAFEEAFCDKRYSDIVLKP